MQRGVRARLDGVESWLDNDDGAQERDPRTVMIVPYSLPLLFFLVSIRFVSFFRSGIIALIWSNSRYLRIIGDVEALICVTLDDRSSL